jgi:hypothetical protein
MAILLLIAASATFAAWLAGITTIHQGKAADFQAHSAKFTTSLSIGYLAREAIKKQVYLSKAQLNLAGEILLQIISDTQVEQGIYD